MFTLQRASNGRTFATSICPAGQFNGGALYAMGMFTLYSGAMGSCSDIVVNAVAIDAGNDRIEVAVISCPEPIKLRVYAR